MDIYMSTGDAAKVLGVTPATVKLMEASGKLHAIRTAGGMRLFDPEEVRNLASERERVRKDA